MYAIETILHKYSARPRTTSRVYVDLAELSGLEYPKTAYFMGNPEDGFTDEEYAEYVAADKKWAAAAKKIAKVHVERALEAQGISFTKITWSRTAGCSCGCSPAFLVHGTAEIAEYWISLKK